MTNFKVGSVNHYFDKIGVAIIDLSSDLSVGERVRFEKGGESLFEQVIESIQAEHQKLETAKKGEVVGIKVKEAVKEGTELFKLT